MLLRLEETQPSQPVELSVEQRDGLHALLPDLKIEAAPGEAYRYILTPGSYIGMCVVGDLAVEIRPKLPIDRVLFLVSYSLHLAEWGDEQVAVDPAAALLEAVVAVFAWHLERALHRGVLQGYRQEEAALMGVRGRVRFDQQVRKRFGLALPVECRYDEFTTDILENRILRAAIHALRGFPQARVYLALYEHLLDGVTLQCFDPRSLPCVQYSRLNQHYRGAIEWARLILSLLSFETRHGEVRAITVRFDMNKVFENFVRAALRDELRLTPREFPSGAGCPSLFLDSQRRIALEPDLSWWTGTTCRFVGDIKYKMVNVAGIKHPDLYQLLAYVTAARLPNGLLIYAAGEGEPAIHDIIMAGKYLHVRALELSGTISAIRSEVRLLADAVRELAAA